METLEVAPDAPQKADPIRKSFDCDHQFDREDVITFVGRLIKAVEQFNLAGIPVNVEIVATPRPAPQPNARTERD